MMTERITIAPSLPPPPPPPPPPPLPGKAKAELETTVQQQQRRLNELEVALAKSVEEGSKQGTELRAITIKVRGWWWWGWLGRIEVVVVDGSRRSRSCCWSG